MWISCLTSLIERNKGIRRVPSWIIFIFKTNIINLNYYFALLNKPECSFSWAVCDIKRRRTT